MKAILLLILLPFSLWGFTPRPITPVPAIGYQEIPLFDDLNYVDRQLLVWYPINPYTTTSVSKNAWDVFEVAPDEPVANSKTKFPVIIISHGWCGNPHQLSWLINGLVHNGFIVLAVEHLDIFNDKVHLNHWKRAVDIKMMLDTFEDHELAEYADLGRVGVAGYSLGGATALLAIGGRANKLDHIIPTPEFASPIEFNYPKEVLATFNKTMMAREWKERRVKAAFVMAPSYGWIFDEASLKKITTPLYIVAPAEDKILVTKRNAGFFSKMVPKAFYQEIPGKAGHYIFITPLSEAQKKAADPKNECGCLFVDDASVDRRWIQTQLIEDASRFFQQNFQKSADSIDEIGRKALKQITLW